MDFTQAIEALGTTPEQVASKLFEMRITGKRQSARCCPIAKYLNACGFSYVTVSFTVKRYLHSEAHTAEESVYLPQGVQQWIRAFDEGKYPEFWG